MAVIVSCRCVVVLAFASMMLAADASECKGSWVDQGQCSSYCGPGKVLQKYEFRNPDDESRCESKGYRIGTCEVAPCPEPTCPGDMIVFDCAPACPATCADPFPKCNEKCKPNFCACPSDTVYHDGHCIPMDLCPPVNCVTSSWEVVGKCSKTCGTGVALQTRSILVEPMHGGDQCGPLERLEECATEVCPIDCPGGMEFAQCGRDCTPTCDNPNPTCTNICTGPRCQCPLGLVLKGAECVAASACSPVRESTTTRRATSSVTSRKTTATSTSTSTSTRRPTTTRSSTTSSTSKRKTTTVTQASSRPTTFVTRGTSTTRSPPTTSDRSPGCVTDSVGDVLLNICDCESKFLDLSDSSKDEYCESCWSGARSDICSEPVTPFNCVYGPESKNIVLLLDQSAAAPDFATIQNFALMDLGLKLPVSDTTPIYVGSIANVSNVSPTPITSQRALSRAINALQSAPSATSDLSNVIPSIGNFINSELDAGRTTTKVIIVADKNREFSSSNFDSAAATLESQGETKLRLFQIDGDAAEETVDSSGDGEPSDRALPATGDAVDTFIRDQLCAADLPIGEPRSPGPSTSPETPRGVFANETLCHENIDFVVVVDNSRSVESAECEKAKELASGSLRHLRLITGDDRIGVIAMSPDSSNRIVVPLSDSSNATSVREAIEGIICDSPSGSIAGSLEDAATLLETEGREDVSKTVVVFTDGNSQDSVSATKSAGIRLQEASDAVRAYTTGDNSNSLALSKISPTFVRNSDELSTGGDLIANVVESNVCDYESNRDMIPIAVILGLLFLLFLLAMCCCCCYPFFCGGSSDGDESTTRSGAAGGGGGEGVATITTTTTTTGRANPEPEPPTTTVPAPYQKVQSSGTIVDTRQPNVAGAWGFQTDQFATRDITRESWEYADDGDDDSIATLSAVAPRQAFNQPLPALKPFWDTVSVTSVSTTVTRTSRAPSNPFPRRVAQPAVQPINHQAQPAAVFRTNTQFYRQPQPDISGWIQSVDDSMSSRSNLSRPSHRRTAAAAPRDRQHQQLESDDPFLRRNIQASGNPHYAGYRNGSSSFA